MRRFDYIFIFISLATFLNLLSCENNLQSTKGEDLDAVSEIDSISEPSWYIYFYPKTDLISCEQVLGLNKRSKDGGIWESENTVRIVDVRENVEYINGHLPGAVNVWRPQIQNLEVACKGIMAPKEQMEGLLSRLGIRPTDFIIVYDGKGNPDAARLWWILNYYGHQKVAIMDGGITNWIASSYEVNTDYTVYQRSNYRFREDENHANYADKQQVEASISDTNIILLDTRSPEEFTGELKKGTFGQGGRIPGSISMDYSNAINYGKNHQFMPALELKKRYEGLGIDSNKEVIVYCQSGVRSAHTTFVLTKLLGYKHVRNYDGSWLEWSYYHELPTENGAL